ncbi:unnamed protein product, partial [Adineta steineri]
TQTISLPVNQLPTVTGQYVGVGFSTGGGSLYAVANRSQYFLSSVSNFSAVTSATYTNISQGIAFSFQLYISGVVFG